MLNVACFVQSRLTDADFVIFSNYCLIGTRRTADNFFWLAVQYSDSPAFTILKLFRAVTVGIVSP